MDIGSLAHVNRSRQLRRMKIYDRLLQNCHKKIKSSSNGDKNKCVCVYKVPPFTFGEPVYNLNTAIIYIIDKLKENGFDAHYRENPTKYVFPGENTFRTSIRPTARPLIYWNRTPKHLPES